LKGVDGPAKIAAIASNYAAHGQNWIAGRNQMPVIGMFLNLARGDLEKAMRRTAILTGVSEGINPALSPERRKIRVITRHADVGAFDEDYLDKANELVDEVTRAAAAGDGHVVYFASCRPTTVALRQATGENVRTVFAGLFDPVDRTTAPTMFEPKLFGYISYDINLCKKWVSTITSLSRSNNERVKTLAVVYDTRRTPVYTGPDNLYEGIKAAATAAHLPTPVKIDVRAADRDQQIRDFARRYSIDGGLIVPAATYTAIHRKDIITAAKRAGIPAIYPNRLYVTDGGLISVGANLFSLYRAAGVYAGRILSDETPPERIVTNDKFETVVNFKLAEQQLNGATITQLQQNADLIIDDEED